MNLLTPLDEETIIGNWEKATPPLVSIIIISYNHERYIESAINGALAQITDFPIEIIIYDDASLDGTQEIIKKYARKYPNIIVPLLQKENLWLEKGVNGTMTIAWPSARGKYFSLCEGDDYWIDPQKIQKQVDVFREFPDTVICGARAKTWNEMKKEFTQITPALETDISCMKSEDFFYLGDWVKTCTRMSPRKLMIQIPHEYGGDYKQVHYLLAKNPHGTFRCLDEVVAVYREHSGGVFSGAKPIDVQKGYFESARLIAKLYDDERAIIMRENAVHAAWTLAFGSSLKWKEWIYYALQYLSLSLKNFSRIGLKRSLDRTLYRCLVYLERYPAFRACLRAFYTGVKRLFGRA